MASKTKSKFAPDAQFQTNDAFASLWPKMARVIRWRGRLVRQHETISGAWHVVVEDPPGLPVQVMNERFMEVAK